MSSLAALTRHLARLGEISSVMSAMKNLALVESRKLARCVEAERAMRANIEAALADFLAFHPQPGAATGPALLIALGSERGFCGNFNVRVLEALDAALEAEPATRPILVGQRLAARWSSARDLPPTMEGATVTEDIPGVLSRLLEQLPASGVAALAVLAHDGSGALVRTPILPLPTLVPGNGRRQAPGLPPCLHLPPPHLFAALLDQYLPAVLGGVLYASLAAESRQRLAHMENALDRLGETLAALTLKRNALRQEQIVEEIEVMLSGR